MSFLFITSSSIPCSEVTLTSLLTQSFVSRSFKLTVRSFTFPHLSSKSKFHNHTEQHPRKFFLQTSLWSSSLDLLTFTPLTYLQECLWFYSDLMSVKLLPSGVIKAWSRELNFLHIFKFIVHNFNLSISMYSHGGGEELPM